MTQTSLSQSMQSLLEETKKKDANMKQIIAKAVQLGMNYQENLIKNGIDIVFKSLHTNKNINK